MLDIQALVDLVCVSTVYHSFNTNSKPNTANAQVYVECKNAPISAKKRDVEFTLANDVDMIQMLDIQALVDLVCVSTVYQSFNTNSKPNTANAQVYVECKNAPISAKKRM